MYSGNSVISPLSSAGMYASRWPMLKLAIDLEAAVLERLGVDLGDDLVRVVRLRADRRSSSPPAAGASVSGVERIARGAAGRATSATPARTRRGEREPGLRCCEHGFFLCRGWCGSGRADGRVRADAGSLGNGVVGLRRRGRRPGPTPAAAARRRRRARGRARRRGCAPPRTISKRRRGMPGQDVLAESAEVDVRGDRHRRDDLQRGRAETCRPGAAARGAPRPARGSATGSCPSRGRRR